MGELEEKEEREDRREYGEEGTGKNSHVHCLSFSAGTWEFAALERDPMCHVVESRMGHPRAGS